LHGRELATSQRLTEKDVKERERERKREKERERERRRSQEACAGLARRVETGGSVYKDRWRMARSERQREGKGDGGFQYPRLLLLPRRLAAGIGRHPRPDSRL